MSSLWAFSGALLVCVLISLLVATYVWRLVTEEETERARRDEILARKIVEITTRTDINADAIAGVQRALYSTLVAKEPPAQTFDIAVTVTPRKGA
jgi:hypothetical protein